MLFYFEIRAPEKPNFAHLTPLWKGRGGRNFGVTSAACFRFLIRCSISKAESFKGDWGYGWKSKPNFAVFDLHAKVGKRWAKCLSKLFVRDSARPLTVRRWIVSEIRGRLAKKKHRCITEWPDIGSHTCNINGLQQNALNVTSSVLLEWFVTSSLCVVHLLIDSRPQILSGFVADSGSGLR